MSHGCLARSSRTASPLVILTPTSSRQLAKAVSPFSRSGYMAIPSQTLTWVWRRGDRLSSRQASATPRKGITVLYYSVLW